MEIKQIEYFLAVVDAGSFSAAAEEQYISQSSLSKQIMALEKELGVVLFDRSKRQIALTPAAKALIPQARNLYANYQTMLASVAPFKSNAILSIVAIPVIAQYGIPSYIARFKQAYPSVQLYLEEREASEILPALENHQFDLAFLRSNYLDQSQYDSLVVANDQLQVILSRQHHMAARKSISLTELSNENFIVFDKGTVVHELTMDVCRAAGFEPRIFYASLRVESILGLVASNSGIALMMKKVFEYHGHSDVVAVPLVETIPSDLVLAWSKRHPLSEVSRQFIDMVLHMKQKALVP